MGYCLGYFCNNILSLFLLPQPIILNRNRKILTKKWPPEAAGGWPLIGHLFQLSGPDPLHITLSNMADKYGPIFSISLGARRGLVVNTWEAAKECYRTNDVAFSNRPRTAALNLMGYNFAMFGFSNYGPYWREMRKISVLRLLSHRKLEALCDARELQIKTLMKSMNEYYYSCVSKEKKAVTVDMGKFFSNLTLSLMVRTVAGDVEKKMGLKEREKWRQTIREFFKMMNVFTLSDVVPFLKWVDYFGGMHKALRRTGRNFDAMLQVWLEEHKKIHKKSSSDHDGEEEEDFMGEMLSVVDAVAHEFPFYDADTINKATCQRSTRIRHSYRPRKTSKRIRHRKTSLHPGGNQGNNAPTATGTRKPRQAEQDCVVAGYHVRAGTCLFVNTWKIQRDPRVWADPLEFRPDRFLTTHKEIDVQGSTLNCFLLVVAEGFARQSLSPSGRYISLLGAFCMDLMLKRRRVDLLM
ncbi:hypothetical protein DH2020_035096 [Rehmannia glutinosa]|uniref:Cytochrome P450 protein n=1 Tax=Rehmannia glutinosa TaxID=99300 RepID=A0ABR0V7G6_REHGL